VLVAVAGRTFAELPAGARIGTSSLRRRAQLLALRPDLAPVDVRGNVPTRIDKVVRGELPAVVLAKAGVTRLGLEAKITEVFEPERLLPAVGQGAIAVEIRRNDGELRELLAPLDHQPTRLAITAERVLLRRLEGGCQVPIGALGRWVNRELVLDGLVADLDGTQVLRDTERGPVADCAEAELAGERLAQKLLDRGADRILAQIAAAARPGTAARS
jgi:hydroxymethylbilane synthase